MPSPLTRALPVILVVVGALVAGAPGAAAVLPAHARLLSSTPADGSTVATATEVVLAFSENPNPDFVQATVEGPGGSVADGEPQVQGRTVTQRLVADLPAGEHTLTYRVVSVDGHPISGTVSFTTTAPPAASPGPSVAPSPSATPTAGTPGPSATGTAASPSPTTSPGTDVDQAAAESRAVWPWLVLGAVVLLGLLVGLLRRRRAAGDPEPPSS